MATCPECWNEKPYFARRCTHCNNRIGFFVQSLFSSVSSIISLGGFVLILYMLWIAING